MCTVSAHLNRKNVRNQSLTAGFDIVLHFQGMWWHSWGCGGAVGYVVAQLGMWCLSWGCGASVRDEVVQLGMWWLSRGCDG
jgi:hypothetical protein